MKIDLKTEMEAGDPGFHSGVGNRPYRTGSCDRKDDTSLLEVFDRTLQI